MFVLMEVEECGSDKPTSDGAVKCVSADYLSAEPGAAGQFAWTKPENIHETPLDVFRAVIELLRKRGYNPRYLEPVNAPPNSLFLMNAHTIEMVKCGQSHVRALRFVVDLPEPEPKLTMEQWKKLMPRRADYTTQHDYFNALEAWWQRMPE